MRECRRQPQWCDALAVSFALVKRNLAEFGGRRFGYSCDTTFDPEHVAFLEPADLIFHECDEGYHSSLEDLEALPEATRAKMRLVHLNDDFNGSSKVEAAEEGKLYRV